MNNDDWYRGDSWDKEAQELFEQNLKKSRGSFNKAQYLRIKGSSLLKSKDKQKQEAGCYLLNRVVYEYPNEISNVMFAYEQLGDYFSFKNQSSEAEQYYRKSIAFYKEHGRSGSSGIGDIKLAEIITRTNQLDKFTEMYHLLTEDFEKTGGSLILNDDIFRYYSVLAKLCDGLGKNKLAKQYAEKALELSKVQKPQLDKYPQLGMIKTDTNELDSLKEIVSK